MIDLRGSRFTDIMPENMASQMETQAFAYALGRQIEKLCAYADGVHIYAGVASMPEKILDVLAVELRTPAYEDSLPIETKRRLIKGTLPFYSKLGTPAAVEWIINAVFGSGGIEEWFDYGGDPHHFKVNIPMAGTITPGMMEELRRMIAGVKRLTSWLDTITTYFEMEDKVYITPVVGHGGSVTKLPALEPELPPVPVYVTPILGRGLSVTVLPSLEPELGTAVASVHPGAAAGSVMVTCLPPAEEFETTRGTLVHGKLSAALSGVMETKLPLMKEEFL